MTPDLAAAALDALADGVLVVSGGEVLVANRAAHRLAGRAAGELAGAPAPASVELAAARGGALLRDALDWWQAAA